MWLIKPFFECLQISNLLGKCQNQTVTTTKIVIYDVRPTTVISKTSLLSVQWHFGKYDYHFNVKKWFQETVFVSI